ncbi:hypothetical protein SUGI_0299160 [Cryptomeria japonica]|uniref:transcription factor MYB21 n=1 Tax=Cryptomeria japonica TaxID=3369 RepID=UPI002408A99E|nr:transcription factor MYB21 [Cryptomeria japonica]GLJ17251.1 hypothetical protein SUGI_0299160 [Cryptomeria japonica]
MSSRWSLCAEKGKLKKGPWTFEEDIRLLRYIKIHGDGRWSTLAKAAGLQRCGKSCRLRWVNYLRPGIKRGNITPEEEGIIIDLHGRWGNRWSLIAERIPGRTDNEIKNYWRSHLKKKLQNSTQTQHIEDQNCCPEAHVEAKQVILPEQSLEVFTGSEIRTPLLYEHNENDASVKVETPTNKMCIEEVIKDMEQVQVQGGEASFVEGSIQNDMGIAGNDVVELYRMLYSFPSGIPIESYANAVYEASCSANPELMYPTNECELDSGSDIMLWNMEPDMPAVSTIHFNGQTPYPSL